MDVELEPISVRLEPVRNAARSWTQRDALLLRLQCPQTGTIGYGEASPLPGFSGETLSDVVRWFETANLGALSFSSNDLARVFDASSPLIEHAPAAARFCVESALFTGFCSFHKRTFEQGMVELGALSGVTAPQRPVLETQLETATLLDVFGDDALDVALAASTAGVTTFKAKIGIDLRNEAHKLRAIVGRLGSCERAIRLRLDANQSLSMTQLRECANEWQDLPIEYVEEPCPTSELLKLDPRSSASLPLALDESLAAGPDALGPWLASGRVVAVVCKPMYLGGIRATLRWVALARSKGANVVMSHLFDGPWAMRIYQAMARVFAPGVAAGLAPHLALAAYRGELARLFGSCD